MDAVRHSQRPVFLRGNGWEIRESADAATVPPHIVSYGPRPLPPPARAVSPPPPAASDRLHRSGPRPPKSNEMRAPLADVTQLVLTDEIRALEDANRKLLRKNMLLQKTLRGVCGLYHRDA